MKQSTKLIATLAAALTVAASAAAFASCSEQEEKATITETYISIYDVTETSTVKDQDGNLMESTSTITYYEQLQLLSDGTYEMTQTQTQSMSNAIIYATGTYTKNAENAKYDGYTEIVLNDATYVQVNQDIYNHMFGLTIDTETSTFPAEIAGGTTMTKEEVLAKYGKFGSRYIMHRATVDATHAENWVDTEATVQVVE